MQSCEEKSKALQGKLKEGLNGVCWVCAEEAGFHHNIIETLKNKVVFDCVLCKFKVENT